MIEKWEWRSAEGSAEQGMVSTKNRFIIDYEVEYGKHYIDLVMS